MMTATALLCGLMKEPSEMAALRTFVREYDDEGREAGYSLRSGLSMLTYGQIQTYVKLPKAPKEFQFAEVTAVCGSSKGAASRLIKRARQAGAMKQTRKGWYVKVVTPDAEEAEKAVVDSIGDADIPF